MLKRFCLRFRVKRDITIDAQAIFTITLSIENFLSVKF